MAASPAAAGGDDDVAAAGSSAQERLQHPVAAYPVPNVVQHEVVGAPASLPAARRATPTAGTLQLAAASHEASVVTASSAAGPAAWEPSVLVKIAPRGRYSELELDAPSLLALRRTTLLRTLCAHWCFKESLTDVPLDTCAVTVCFSGAAVPSSHEESFSYELAGMASLASLHRTHCPAQHHIFITVTPVAHPAAPPSTTVLSDACARYVHQLLAAPMRPLETVADLRAELAESVPAVMVGPGLALELQAHSSAEVTFLPPDGCSQMVKIAHLFEHAWLVHPQQDRSEEEVASIAHCLTDSVWRVLDGISMQLHMTSGRNMVDPSEVTEEKLRPDYWLNSDGALLLKAEHKRRRDQLLLAKAELASKMKAWNPVTLRGLPFVPCYAVGGLSLQFCAVVRGVDGRCRVEDASEVFDMSSQLHRLQIVRMALNMFRVLVALRRIMPPDVPPLYTKQAREGGAYVMIMDDHVVKRCKPEDSAIYALLAPNAAAIPNCVAVQVQHTTAAGDMILHITPVCSLSKPASVAQLRAAIRCVLVALDVLHANGFNHRDVRWPNVLCGPDLTGRTWLLADWELAGRDREVLPARYRDSDGFAPETRAGRPYTHAADVWQVGRLAAAETFSAMTAGSAAAAAFITTLTAAEPSVRPSCADALLHEWLAGAE